MTLSRATYSTVQDENEWKKEWEGPTLISFLPPAGAAGCGPTNTESTGTLARTVLYAQPLCNNWADDANYLAGTTQIMPSRPFGITT